VLIVDDSTFVRRALARSLRAAPDIDVVGEARDGISAVQMARELRPDVMTLDLQMPELSGLDVLRVIAGELPTRVIMVSSFTTEGAEETFRALEEGAFDFVDKTSARNRLDLSRLGQDLIAKIRLAAGQPSRPPVVAREKPPLSPAIEGRPSSLGTRGLLLVGASTGGPPAIRRFLAGLRPDIETPVVIVQHMPPGFSSGFARRLNQTSPLLCSELTSGGLLVGGHVYVVPSGFDFVLSTEDEGLRASLRPAPEDAQHRPSLDAAFRAAALPRVRPLVGVVLTGMGMDGAAGVREFVAVGGEVYVQDEDSSAIYGMPRAVRGAVPVVAEGDPETLGILVMGRLSRSGNAE
jgi:two-component system chemotaxis response regulator CheB